MPGARKNAGMDAWKGENSVFQQLMANTPLWAMNVWNAKLLSKPSLKEMSWRTA